MIRFKACPKCAGDLYVNKDVQGNFLNCLQCGYLKDIKEAAETLSKPVTVEEKRSAA